jgi:hypothetical protein
MLQSTVDWLVASSGHVVYSLTRLSSCYTVISIVVLRYKIMHGLIVGSGIIVGIDGFYPCFYTVCLI